MSSSKITKAGCFHEVLKYYNVQGYQSDLYLFLGKSTDWTDKDQNGVIDDDEIEVVNGGDYEDKLARKNIIVLQKMNQSNISPVLDRVDWKEGLIASCAINPIEGKVDYARTSNDQVFKCLWNNNGEPSTVEPYIDTTGGDIHNAKEYEDGYVWIYVTTLDVGAKYQFFDDNYMPIQPYSLFDDIDSDSIGLGQIEWIHVTDGGSGYDRVPSVTIEGDGSTQAVAYATLSGDKVNKIYIVNKGTDYTSANVVIAAPVTEGGVAAKAQACISPIGGTASNPCVELGCTKVSLDVILEAINEDIPINTTFTQIGLISQPKKLVNGKSVDPKETKSSSTIKAYSTLTYTKTTTNTEIMGGSRLVKKDMDGNIVFSGDVIYDDTEKCEIYLINTFGKPVMGDTVTVVDSYVNGITKIVNSYSDQEFAKHTGNIIYIENRRKTRHTKSGNEQFRITISFHD